MLFRQCAGRTSGVLYERNIHFDECRSYRAVASKAAVISIEIFIWDAMAYLISMVLASSVFLNTFPFGAGITTSEALSMCVPLVVLPDFVSTAQLALSQVELTHFFFSINWKN